MASEKDINGKAGLATWLGDQALGCKRKNAEAERIGIDMCSNLK